jgi:DNA-binding MarR family transcriptional regulator
MRETGGMTAEQKPIGYWLKHVDRLIDGTFELALASHGLTRRHWQIMNVLRSGPADDDAIAAAVQPFWSKGAVTLDEVLRDLIGRGWVEREDGPRYRLSPEGEAARVAASAQVEAIRDTSTRGITKKEYDAAVDTLRRIARNLESAIGDN